MTVTIKHSFQSTNPDGPDSSQVQPSNWNANHVLTGGAALTKTDDTNVTLTLGGSPTTALLEATSITAGWTGTLAVARGGTGASTASGARTALSVPATDGTGASGTWGISISGTATTATTANALNASNNYIGTVFTGSGNPATEGQINAVAGSASTWYKVFLRNDASDVYFLSSNVQTSQSAANSATWNSLRPFKWNLSTGAVAIDGTGAGTSFGGAITLGTALSVANGGTGSTTAAAALTALGAQGAITFTSGGSGYALGIEIGSTTYYLAFMTFGSISGGGSATVTYPVTINNVLGYGVSKQSYSAVNDCINFAGAPGTTSASLYNGGTFTAGGAVWVFGY